MSLNLYDLLDVDEAASADEVRAAWKTAIADLEPTDRRFRAFNDAAGVLLDPARRAAYDEELAAARASEAPPEPAREPKPKTEAKADKRSTISGTPIVYTSETPASDAGRAGPNTWALLTAGVLALLAVVLAVWVLTRPGVGDSTPKGSADVTAGPSSVENFVSDTLVPAMSYDYRTWKSDLAKFEAYMTPAEAAKYQRGWKAIGPQVEQQKAIVASHAPDDAPGTGLTRVSDDGTRAVVLAFIDQDVRKAATAPFTLKMWATFVLDKDPSTGSWLVDNVCTDTACS